MPPKEDGQKKVEFFTVGTLILAMTAAALLSANIGRRVGTILDSQPQKISAPIKADGFESESESESIFSDKD